MNALGLGPIPERLTAGRVEVRQAGVLATGIFLAVVFAGMTVAVLHDPGEIGSGGPFLNRWVFGALVVPAAFGIRRYLFRPRVVVDAHGVRIDNAFSSVALPWSDVAGARGGGFVEVVGTDGDCARALIYGPTFAGPLTRDTRPRALVALIRVEAARRAGVRLADDEAAAELVAADLDADPDVSSGHTEPVIHPRTTLGLVELGAVAVAWTVACAIAAALA